MLLNKNVFYLLTLIIFQECTIVRVGSSKNAKQIKVMLTEDGLQCPPIVTKSNWVGDSTANDHFVAAVSGRVLIVEKTNGNSWGFDLRIRCCKADRPIYKEGKNFNLFTFQS